MRWLLPAAAVTFFLVVSSAIGSDWLPSHVLDLPQAVVPDIEPASFDLIDWRTDAIRSATPVPSTEVEQHSHFGIKHHIGFAAGYDNGVLHGSLGLYLTVAEWGRWNYGVPSPALGFGRYQMYDAARKLVFMHDESTLFISLASVHYRGGHLQSLGLNWYLNLEQIFDLRQNSAGSQVGITFSNK